MDEITPTRRLRRSHEHRMVAGVSGGLAEYLDVDPTLIRLAWIAALFATGPMAFFAYLAFWLVMQRDQYSA